VRYPGRRWPSAHTENRCRHNRERDDDQGQASCSIAWASSPVSPRCHRLIIASPSSFVRVVVGKGVRFSSASICRPAAPLSAGARRTPPAFHLGPTRGSCGCVSNRPRPASVPPASPGRVRWRLLATPLLSGRSNLFSASPLSASLAVVVSDDSQPGTSIVRSQVASSDKPTLHLKPQDPDFPEEPLFAVRSGVYVGPGEQVRRRSARCLPRAVIVLPGGTPHYLRNVRHGRCAGIGRGTAWDRIHRTR
jgi:hypothetical protein